ncbi:MAG: PD40 domain-containing protein [Anaerolineae bacterium]|nr:PD40 domain-containing protein [Anaerolineae bacterium]
METEDAVDTENSQSRRLRWGVVLGILVVGVLVALVLWQQWGQKQLFPARADAHILYLGWEDGANESQLFVVNADGSGQKRLTEEPRGVLDYAVSPTGSQIVYSAINEDDSVDLWQINAAGRNRKRLLECPDATCTQPAWAPDGRRLIYERRENGVRGEAPSPPRLWWLDTQTGETISVFQDAQQLGLGARISPNGRYLSYISPTNQEVHIYDIKTGENIIIPSQTGQPGIWSPDSETLLVNDIQFQGEQFSIHLFSTNLATAELTNLSGAALTTNDSLPVFSPDGEWIAFGRKKPRAPMGNQLWLMRPDGSEAVNLTEDAEVHYNNPAWSPDGSQLVMQGFSLAEPEAAPSLWLVDVASGLLEEIVLSGMQPTWLP